MIISHGQVLSQGTVMEYQSLSTNYLEVIAEVKVFNM
jgi:hypothetical protein